MKRSRRERTSKRSSHLHSRASSERRKRLVHLDQTQNTSTYQRASLINTTQYTLRESLGSLKSSSRLTETTTLRCTSSKNFKGRTKLLLSLMMRTTSQTSKTQRMLTSVNTRELVSSSSTAFSTLSQLKTHVTSTLSLQLTRSLPSP